MKNETNSNIAVILGGYVNGYNIIRELHDSGVNNIVLFSGLNQAIARHSNKVNRVIRLEFTAEKLLLELENLHDNQNYLVIYPTNDLHLELLDRIYDKISSYAFVPLNSASLEQSLRKDIQYDMCEKIGVPYPASILVTSLTQLDNLDELQFPILIKPAKRDDLTFSGFRNLYIRTSEDLVQHESKLAYYLQNNVPVVVSECIPGDGSQIYAYTAYRSKKGKILNSWIGKKLAQHPDAYGVFSSASNEAPEIIREQGKAIIEAMDLYGILEPEFKYDVRDSKYKLMEINLRSMMWHRTGHLSGVKLQYTQWCDALGKTVPKYTQFQSKIIHFVYFKHELSNLLGRRRYIKHFVKNVLGAKNIYFAVFDKTDIKPFMVDTLSLPKVILGRWMKTFLKK